MNIQFLTAADIALYHELMLEKTPGLPGIADEGRITALCSRVENLHYYEGESDLFVLASMYLIAISRGHVFNDANKRTSLHSTLMFLRRNDIRIRFDRQKLVDITVAAASGQATLQDITSFLKSLG